MAEEGPGPKTIAVTFTEGGRWYNFIPGIFRLGARVHSIKFENGAIWDVHNGWRKPTKEE